MDLGPYNSEGRGPSYAYLMSYSPFCKTHMFKFNSKTLESCRAYLLAVSSSISVLACNTKTNRRVKTHLFFVHSDGNNLREDQPLWRRAFLIIQKKGTAREMMFSLFFSRSDSRSLGRVAEIGYSSSPSSVSRCVFTYTSQRDHQRGRYRCL